VSQDPSERFDTAGISQLIEAYQSGETTSEKVVSRLIDRIDADALNVFISTPSRDALLEQARAQDARRAAGEEVGPLAGVPIAIKDNLCQVGTKTTAGSKILESFTAPYNATVVEKLETAGAILVGKTNLDEFAMGSSNEHSAFGAVRNPHDQERVPGGSSGGSAAAVAANLCAASLGSDTGGSIRQPASHCGVGGRKPTYGRVSRFGLIAFASSLDQIGPMARSVEDTARVLQVIAGHDPMDMTSATVDVPDFLANLDKGVEGLKIGVPREYFETEGADERVLANVRASIEALKAKGATLVDISLPHTEYAISTYYLIATAEASSNLARFDGVRYGHRAEEIDSLESLYERSRAEGFGEEVKRRIMLGTFVLSAGFYDAYYLKAQKVRTLIRQDFTNAFKEVDVIACPTVPAPPFALGECDDDPMRMYLADIYTISCNLAGLPGISVPSGEVDGLPVGLQLLGAPFDEATLLRAAAAV
jgi:aspartyl-tRNA(Asn)/glutamyl-tRNA(Gln) amidotransferase subunit A